MNILNRGLISLGAALVSAMLISGAAEAKASEVLVTVGDATVTADDLEMALGSSPFATQFNALEEQDQAVLRGDLLKRLVALRLLGLEARAQGLDKSPEYRQEMQSYRTAQLYRSYIAKLRSGLKIPEQELQALEKKYRGQSDTLAAAKASYLVDAFRNMRLLTLQLLRERQHVVFFEDRIKPGMSPDTILMQGDDIAIRYRDLVEEGTFPKTPDKEWIEEQLYQRAELLIFAQAAAQEGVDISREMKTYGEELLPALLSRKLEQKWAPDDDALRAYLQNNPELARIPERWHVGQLVASSYAQAAAMKKRIEQGASLFRLAGRYSIDPYGRAHNGDMGWLKEGEGSPKMEALLKQMADGEVSDVIQTPKGFHLVTVLERRPGKYRKFATMKDKIRQAIVNEQLAVYLQGLQEKYTVEWKVLAENAPQGKVDE